MASFFFGFQKLGLQSIVGTMAADLSFTDACWLCPCEARVTASDGINSGILTLRDMLWGTKARNDVYW